MAQRRASDSATAVFSVFVFQFGKGPMIERLTHSVFVSNSKKSLKHVRLASVRILTPWCVRDESALDVAAP